MGTEKGRKTKPNLKVGICGEHGGDAESVKFCHRIGMNYVSCSPFRVPIARLAAAQAAIDDIEKKFVRPSVSPVSISTNGKLVRRKKLVLG